MWLFDNLLTMCEYCKDVKCECHCSDTKIIETKRLSTCEKAINYCSKCEHLIVRWVMPYFTVTVYSAFTNTSVTGHYNLQDP